LQRRHLKKRFVVYIILYLETDNWL